MIEGTGCNIIHSIFKLKILQFGYFMNLKKIKNTTVDFFLRHTVTDHFDFFAGVGAYHKYRKHPLSKESSKDILLLKFSCSNEIKRRRADENAIQREWEKENAVPSGYDFESAAAEANASLDITKVNDASSAVYRAINPAPRRSKGGWHADNTTEERHKEELRMLREDIKIGKILFWRGLIMEIDIASNTNSYTSLPVGVPDKNYYQSCLHLDRVLNYLKLDKFRSNFDKKEIAVVEYMLGYMLKFEKGILTNRVKKDGKWTHLRSADNMKKDILRGDKLIKRSADNGYARAKLAIIQFEISRENDNQAGR